MKHIKMVDIDRILDSSLDYSWCISNEVLLCDGEVFNINLAALHSITEGLFWKVISVS